MKCVYCGSSNYGSGCLYSPVNCHAHMDNSDKCIYCGSSNYGSGCLLNPYGNTHIKGGLLFQKIKEQLQKSTVLTHLFEMLDQSNDLKYKSPLDRFYKRFAASIRQLSQPFLESFLIIEKPILESVDMDTQLKISELRENLEIDIKNLRKSIQNANTSLPTEIVEKMLIDAIINSCDKS